MPFNILDPVPDVPVSILINNFFIGYNLIQKNFITE